MLRSVPSLPPSLVKELLAGGILADKESISLSATFHGARCYVVNGDSPDLFDVGGREPLIIPIPGMSALARKSERTKTRFMTVAISQRDTLTVCELIRLNADLERLDEDGRTPLMQATEELGALAGISETPAFLQSFNLAVSGAMNGFTWGPSQFGLASKRLRFIIKTLVAHHADVNVRARFGYTPLMSMCLVGEWDMIKLLLEHGADPFPTPTGVTKSIRHAFKNEEDRTRYLMLVEKYRASVRPARVCRCFSGKPMSICHLGQDRNQPYPPPFMCPCASGKAHEKCCLARDIVWREFWDNDRKFMQRFHHRPTFRTVTVPPELSDVFNTVKALQAADVSLPSIFEEGMEVWKCSIQWLWEMAFDAPEVGVSAVPQDFKQKMFGVIKQLHAQGQIDRAFLYGVRALQRVPYASRQSARIRGRRMREKWNAAIDQYISGSGDRRPTLVIERAAKIGTMGGPLYRNCEGEDCKQMEPDVTLFTCSKCRTPVYCSVVCQRRAWQRHKKVCESGNGELQKLPSQQAFEGQMERVLSSDFVACAASPALAGQIESIRSGMSDEQRVKYGKALKNIRRQPYDHVDGREYAPLPSFMRVQPELD